MPNAPVKTIRAGNIQVAIWENEYKGQKHYNCTVKKSYKTDDGWKDTDFLGKGDILFAIKALDDAFDFINNDCGSDF